MNDNPLLLLQSNSLKAQIKKYKVLKVYVLILVLLALFIGIMVGTTYSALSSKATSTGTLTFAVNGHEGTFNIQNGYISKYNTKQNLYTKFYIMPNENYTSNADIGITMGESALTSSAYNYVASTGELSLKNTAITDNLTINISFIGKSVSVTLNVEGGSGGQSSAIVNYGSAMTSISIPTKNAYNFMGYYTGTNGTGIQYYNENGVSTKNCDFTTVTTLYACWEPIKYTITYVYNDGATTNTTQDYYINSTTALSAPPSYIGYTFAGWKVVSDSVGSWINDTDYPTGEKLTGKYGNVTLSAQWDKDLTNIIIINASTSSSYYDPVILDIKNSTDNEIASNTFTGINQSFSYTIESAFNLGSNIRFDYRAWNEAEDTLSIYIDDTLKYYLYLDGSTNGISISIGGVPFEFDIDPFYGNYSSTTTTLTGEVIITLTGLYRGNYK